MEKMNLSTWNSSLMDEFLVLKVPVRWYESKNHQWSIHKVFKYLHNCWVKRRTEVSCYQRTTTCNNDIESGRLFSCFQVGNRTRHHSHLRGISRKSMDLKEVHALVYSDLALCVWLPKYHYWNLSFNEIHKHSSQIKQAFYFLPLVNMLITVQRNT